MKRWMLFMLLALVVADLTWAKPPEKDLRAVRLTLGTLAPAALLPLSLRNIQSEKSPVDPGPDATACRKLWVCQDYNECRSEKICR